ncbi:MAG: tRNA pseudouridine(55) synthase TruB [Brevibacterium sp.]|uniref:tRNA pseudouridine(55) synthase TruB n=1 Tax=Brevibacterium sp. TaxID=1701 RepID=UPI002648529D|nr:tRNA pseudouridine(55) synthase TruB [Brevibacterium sp.]MDN5807652.1 tRNA pseudouridine(55) synthase TruB [Brevibacterium sp.]MDN5834669.1 tRNA pseudouridine(55) synthase TruB [Brevibacterium sp.]MDN5877218.1 tRNA pseudouridine(55) synthase TruB [Brevibacterium sp.]MDN5909050.1 tRNA pseudouridine(55) synthase TruB [Brevibacterium sp.]MDN6124559.1 tRNA pseudouridine(55) synthase TruB [Brevibacterium sp.]
MSDASPQGVLVCDKPQGLTSHGVVSRIRRWYGTRKVGHAGTLDPMATGVLVLGLGRGTKLLGYITGVSKTYLATIRLGSATPTDDADSDPDLFAEPAALSAVTDDGIAQGVTALTGPIDQVPSAVSAIKVNGQRSYARVRAGEDVELKARGVEISSFTILNTRYSVAEGHIDVDVEVDCSSGTYVRALARDLGNSLGVHGHLIALRRTRVGAFGIDDAVTIPVDLDAEAPPLTSLAEVARSLLPTVHVDAAEAKALMQGKIITTQRNPDQGDEVAVVCGDELVSIAAMRAGGGLKSQTAFAIDLA